MVLFPRSGAVARRTPHLCFRIGVVAGAMLLSTALVNGQPASAADLLGVPTAVVAVAGNNTAQVTWSPPVAVDPAMVSYQVIANPGGQSVSVPGSQTSATVRFLTNGTTYTFRVAAFTFDDLGPLSEPSLPVTPLDLCTVVGTPGDDVLTGTRGNDAICGLGGNDTLRGMGGGDTFVGGGGADIVDFGEATGPVFAILPSVSWIGPLHGGLGWANGDGSDVLRSDIESLYGSAYGDVLEGDDKLNTIVGREGNDLIRGWGGNDKIRGHSGADELWGHNGDDDLAGGDGNDVLMPRGDRDRVDGGRGTDMVTFTVPVVVDLAAGTAQTAMSSDVLSSVENVTGSSQGDRIRGSAVANVLRGGDGDDVLTGLKGNDKLYGEEGSDSLAGGRGTSDRCDGGEGTDTASGCESQLSIP